MPNRRLPLEDIPLPPVGHPMCPQCGVPMWMIELEHITAEPPKHLARYECKICDAQMVLPFSK